MSHQLGHMQSNQQQQPDLQSIGSSHDLHRSESRIRNFRYSELLGDHNWIIQYHFDCLKVREMGGWGWRTVIYFLALVNISLFKTWQFVRTGEFGLGLEMNLTMVWTSFLPISWLVTEKKVEHHSSGHQKMRRTGAVIRGILDQRYDCLKAWLYHKYGG